MNYKQLILDRLLNKYERSKSFTDGRSQRRVLLRMGKKDFKEYNIEKPLIRETINSVVKDLAGIGLVDFDWLEYEKGNIIDKVWLNISRVEDSYATIGRRPKRDKLTALAKRVSELKAKAGQEGAKRKRAEPEGANDWIGGFLEAADKAINERATTAGVLPTDQDQAKAILDALNLILDLQGDQLIERVFSLRCYGDSKYFEKKVRQRLVGIIKRYGSHQEMREEMIEEDLLLQAGILQSPEQVEFKGGIKGLLNGVRIDFSAFSDGISINMATADKLTIEGMGNTKRILFIENKANYIQLVAENADDSLMLVLHGGFYSLARGLFFRKLYEAGQPKGVEYLHWGDIDLGGFLIFKRLKENIIPSLKPYMMDVEAFEEGKKYWMDFGPDYGKKLERLLLEEGFEEFQDLISLMVKKGKKLEQEVFLGWDGGTGPLSHLACCP